jgi:hypothetical protein
MSPLVKRTQTRLFSWRLLEALAALILLLGGGLALSLLLFGWGAEDTQWGRIVLLVWGLGLLGVAVWKLVVAVAGLFSRKQTLRLLEKSHPEYANRLSTLDYLERNDAEARTLGFSPDLIRALEAESRELPAPTWERLGLTPSAHRPALVALALGVACWVVALVVVPSQVAHITRVWIHGHPAHDTPPAFSLLLPDRVQVPLSQEVVIPARPGQVSIDLNSRGLPESVPIELLIRRPGETWKKQGTIHASSAVADSATSSQSVDREVRFAVKQPLELVALAQGVHSNICRIEPIFPPAVEEFSAEIRPPAYSGLEASRTDNPRLVEGLEGSEVSLSWTGNNPLQSATLEVLSATRGLLERRVLGPETELSLNSAVAMDREKRLILTLRDHHGQTASVPETRLLPIPDKAPEAVIASPTRESVLPDSLLVPITLRASDDIRVAKVELVHRIVPGMPGQPDFRQTLADISQATVEVQAVTEAVFFPVLDLTQAGLWPGDQVSYWVEVVDYRGDNPGKVGRSETHTIRYPTVDEDLDEMAAMRAESADGLQQMIEEQKEISRQFKEIRQDMQRNLGNQTDPEAKWNQQKKLSETLERQENVEEQLAEVAENFEESLRRLSEDNEITLRTLQKFEQVQSLLEQVLNEETKQLIQEIQESLEKMQKDQLRPEDMENTEMDLAEFEKQLDRQLELLENMWMEQEMEALAEKTQELADRQKELLEETKENLLTEKEAAQVEEEAEKADSLADQMEGLENLIEELAKNIEEGTSTEQADSAQEQLAQDESVSDASSASSEESALQEASLPEEATGEAEDREVALNIEEASQVAQATGENSQPEPADLKSASQESNSGQEPSEASEQSEQSESSESEGESEQQSSNQQQSAQQEQQPSAQSQEDQQSGQQESPEQQPSEYEQILAERQEQLNAETERMLEELRRLREKAEEREHPNSEQLADMEKSPETQTLPQDQQSAKSNLDRKESQQAAKNQSSASKKLQQLASMMSSCCGGDKSMEESLAKMKVILERAFILSEESETNDRELSRFKGLASWPNVDRMSELGQEMGWYKQESLRLSDMYKETTEQNPFADFSVVHMFDHAARNWRENTRIMEESSPLVVSTRSHQSLAQVNLAIEKLLDSIQQTESQCQSGGSSGLEGYYRSLKKVLQQQQQINQESESLSQEQKEPGKQTMPGSKGTMQERLQRMAAQQEQTRRMLQELEERYQNVQNRPGNLEGIGDAMSDVQKELEHGNLNDEVVDMQRQIEQRLLDAEKSLHNQGYEKQRRALRAIGEGAEPSIAEEAPVLSEDEKADLARLLRRNMDEVSPHWRDRVRGYYDRLLQMNP